MKTIVINLEKDSKKRERVDRILSNICIDYEIFNAINGRALPDDFISIVNEYSKSFIEKSGRALNRGEIGLYLSHIRLLEWFMSTSLESICVLEDDFDLSKEFKKSITEIEEKQLFFDFDILMIGHFLNRKDKGIIGSWREEKKGRYVSVRYPCEPNYGTHAYIITREGARKVLDKFSAPACPIDHVLGISELFGIKRKILKKPIVYQSILFESTIQSGGFKNENIILYKIKYVIKVLLHTLDKNRALRNIKIFATKNI